MPFFVLSAFLLLIAYPMTGMGLSVWVLAASQLILLVREVKTKQATGVGGFIFMSFLFFGIRPIHLLIERDYKLFTQLFLIRVDMLVLTDAMWWATAGLWCFAFAAFCAPRFHFKYFMKRKETNVSKGSRASDRPSQVGFLLFLQVMALVVMVVLAVKGRTLYKASLGAYIYDFPVVLQAVHLFAVVTIFDRYLRVKNMGSIACLAASGLLFLVLTWLMRDVSSFRGFYLTGLVALFIAGLQRTNPRWGFVILIVPVLLLQPAFRYLGGVRAQSNEEMDAEELIEVALPSKNLAQAYWDFYDYSGDMNIFDTFVAAKYTEPRFKPYAVSWLYVPLHFIPRAIWKGKPKQGMTMDMSFARGAPYSPGIAGFFLRDGGLIWMLFSMALLGYLVSMADWYALTMQRSVLQYCLIGILTVNGMFLSRLFLWQYFYQVLYAVIPCIVLYWWLNKDRKMSRASRIRRFVPALRSRDERVRV